MIICIEGTDGTGKTTLAREFEARGFEYVHNGPPSNGQKLFDHYAEQILGFAGQNVVFDRLHVGELVYGPVMRGKSLITLEEMRILNRLLFAQGARVIFCDTDDSVIEANWLKRRKKEYVDDADKLWEVMTQYRDLRSQFHYSLRSDFDYISRPVESWVDSHFGIKELPFSYPLACREGIWGNPKAMFLVVGEQPGGKKDDPKRVDRAFCTMGGSSGYINQCLWDAGYPEHELQFTNAKRLDGTTRNLRDLYEGRVVITVGTVARETCFRQGVPHLSVDHPAYVKRFHAGQRSKYVTLLRQFRTGV